MVTYFNRKDLVSFGNYLFSKQRELNLKQANIENPNLPPYEDRFKTVSRADVLNWKESIDKN